MFRLLLYIYEFVYSLLLIVYLPVLLYRSTSREKSFHAFTKRVLPPPSQDSSLPRLWVHAVSVGEVKVIQPLKEVLPLKTDQIFISTITETGQDLAQELFKGEARFFYFPLDWIWLCRRYLKRIRPSLIVLVETEIWPGFIWAARSLDIPIILINGRVSDQSYNRYGKVRFFLAPLLYGISRFCMQSARDQNRIIHLGADPDRVRVTGNLKYDYRPGSDRRKLKMVERVRCIIKPQRDSLLWICASTHPGEESLLLDVFEALCREIPSLRLLLAPRHPYRANELSDLLEARQLSYLRQSQLSSQDRPSPRVWLLDTIGDLAFLYQLADVVFIGGSLKPFGGHNLLEAAFFGKPVLFGPHMENFRETATSFLESSAALQVQCPKELSSAMRDLLANPVTRETLGENARRVVKENQGAVKQTAHIVRQYL